MLTTSNDSEGRAVATLLNPFHGESHIVELVFTCISNTPPPPSVFQLSSKHQSVGGMSNATPPSVATTVLKNVKKGITALSMYCVLSMIQTI